jgi:hypothetical protein
MMIVLLTALLQTVVVDMELLKSRHIGVQVKINGEGPFRVIFDTGSPVTLISPKIAKKAGVKSAGIMGMSKVDTLEIGGLKAEDVSVMVFDHPTVKQLSAVDDGLEGIIGFSFYSRYNLVIDYKESKLSFTPCSYKAQDVMAKMQQKLMGGRNQKQVTPRQVVLGITLEDEKPVITSVAPGSAAEAAGLKSGDTITLLDARWVEKSSDIYEIASTLPAGDTVTVNVIREGKEVEVNLKLRKGL